MSRISTSTRSIGGWALALTVGAVIVVTAGSAAGSTGGEQLRASADASTVQVSGIGTAAPRILTAPDNTWGD
ncbi:MULTISPECIES: hypothetical protein [Streptomyces]|uniref:hypothetical protein n=1 Tax=Streptomyces TaxID=1883 RepID=UPI0004BE5E15|nr:MULTISPECIES: hypothetical protein [Streptomyces]